MIDDLARIAAHDLRATTTGDVDGALAELYVGHQRRRRRGFAVAAAATAMVLAVTVGWWSGHALTREARLSPATTTPTHGIGGAATCSGSRPCLGPATFRFALTRPVRWEVPGGYQVSRNPPTPWTVQADAQRGQQGGGPYEYSTVAGVTLLEGVRAASADGRPAASRVGRAPRALVSWLATRPYLRASPVTPTHLDGLPAWHVRVSLAPGVGAGAASCGKVACYPVTVAPDRAVNGIWGSMVADLTAFRLPGAGTSVVWSWAFSHDLQALTRNLSAVRGLSWPTG